MSTPAPRISTRRAAVVHQERPRWTPGDQRTELNPDFYMKALRSRRSLPTGWEIYDAGDAGSMESVTRRRG